MGVHTFARTITRTTGYARQYSIRVWIVAGVLVEVVVKVQHLALLAGDARRGDDGAQDVVAGLDGGRKRAA